MKIYRECNEVAAEIDIPDLANACVKNYLSGNAVLLLLYVIAETQDDRHDEHFFVYEKVETALGLNEDELNDAIVELETVGALSLSTIDYVEEFEGCACLDFEDWIPNMTKNNFCELISKLASLHITEAEFQLIAAILEDNYGEFPLTTLLRVTGIHDKDSLDVILTDLANIGVLKLFNPLEWDEELVDTGCHEQFSYQLGVNHHFEQWGNIKKNAKNYPKE